MSSKLNNKKILITGSSGGIGKALCKKFIEKGCILICTSSNFDRMEKLKKEFGKKHFFYKIDLSNMTEVSENMKLISQNHKDIDVLINNAGSTSDSLLLRMKSDQWNDIIDINLNSNFYIIKEILPLMIKNKSGSIIGISSVVALTGNPGQANYAASKSAMIGMYKSLALEVYTEKHGRWRKLCESSYNTAEIIIAKQRHGPIGTIKAHFDSSFTKFSNLSNKDYDNISE